MALTVAELAFLFYADDDQVRKALVAMKSQAGSTAGAMDKSMSQFWRDEQVRAKRSVQVAEKAGKDAGSKFKAKLAEGMRGAAIPLLAAFGGAEVVRFFGSTLTAASDLNEEVSKSRVIFGDASKAIFAYAGDAQKNILLTQTQAIQAAGTFGVFGKSAGLAGNDLADFSTKLVGLSSDFSSFFNASPAEAIEAIGAALRGESEPIRRFGILLDDATLRQRALSLGLVDSTKNSLTPAIRVQAAYAEILAQSKDAQGDASRTQDGYANSTRILAKDIGELKVKIGNELLPVAAGFVHFLTADALPAMEGFGHGIHTVASFFDGLPQPVKLATFALLAFKAASALGWTDKLASGVDNLGGSMDSLRLRLMFARDAFHETGSSMQALREGTRGVKAGLGSLVGFLGGPWGIALTAATAGVAYFWQENQKAKQHVNELTATLDENTGAITKNTEAKVRQNLEESGILSRAQKAGLNLKDVTDAALGSAAAFDKLRRAQAATMIETSDMGGGTHTTGSGVKTNEIAGIIGQLEQESAALDKSKASAARLAAAAGNLADTTGDASSATAGSTHVMQTYADRIDHAFHAVRRLRNEENKRRLDAVQDRRDAIALRETFRAANKEAAHGKQVLDDGTKAADANMSALLDLADQWNNSTGNVRNAKGAYADMKQEFIVLAEKMGASDTRAKHLAKTLLTVPHTVIPVDDKALQDAIRHAKELKALLASQTGFYIGGPQHSDHANKAYADGGEVRGMGGRRADRALSRTSPGEWITPNGPSQRFRGVLEAVQKGDAAAVAAAAAARGPAIDYSRLGETVAAALGGRIAPVMHVDTMRVADMREAERHARGQEQLAGVGGVKF